MLTLVIDTSWFRGGVGIFENETPLLYFVFPEERKHVIYLPLYIQRLLDETQKSLDDISLISVTIGPGSFTGLRVGISIAKGLSYALKKPIKGIGSLEAIAANFPQRRILPTVKIRKDFFLGALFEGGIPPIKLSEDIVGSLSTFENKNALLITELQVDYPLLIMKGVAKLAKYLFEKEGSDNPFALSPKYIEGGQPS